LTARPAVPNAEDVASQPAREASPRPLLTLGRVDRLRVQVGYRAGPDDPAHEQYLLDLPVPPDGAVDEAGLLAALEPVLYAGADAPRHYSLHQHRWHTSWGLSPGALEIGLLVTTGPTARPGPAVTAPGPAHDGVTRAFRDLLVMVGRPPDPAPLSRDAAVLRARRSAAAAYAVDPDGLRLSAEEHHSDDGSWTISLTTTAGDEYDVLVGLVDGYPASVRVRHAERTEVFDSVGTE
jgi:hypothetical protein